MFKFMLSFGCLAASLAGLSGALLGMTRTAMRGASRKSSAGEGARFSTFEIAVLMR